jgi:hypothetical protein
MTRLRLLGATAPAVAPRSTGCQVRRTDLGATQDGADTPPRYHRSAVWGEPEEVSARRALDAEAIAGRTTKVRRRCNTPGDAGRAVTLTGCPWTGS